MMLLTLASASISASSLAFISRKGQSVVWRALSATLPMTHLAMPDLPWVVMAIMVSGSCSAASTISWAGAPSRTDMETVSPTLSSRLLASFR